jgi:hypothetical protein
MSPSLGSLSASGNYTAPASITSRQTVQIRATSVADPTKSATATVTLTPPPAGVTVSVSPATVSLGQGRSQQFTATVTGSSNTAVTWTMNPSLGSLSASGNYTAPASITSQQTVQIRATSVADPTKSAVATVTLVPIVSSPPPTGYSVSFRKVSSTLLSVSWTAPAGHSQYDSVSLTGDDSVQWWYLWQQETGPATSGSFTLPMPTVPGLWQFRYNANSKILAVSSNLPVGVSQFSVSANATSVSPQGMLTVSWTAPAGRPQTWADTVGLYLVGSTLDQPVAFQYTMGATQGTFTMPAPGKAGVYELRYVTEYVMTARSAPVTVQ